jgi:transcription elongation factor Elf1
MMDKGTYIEAKGLICPFCGRDSIEGGFIEVDAGKAFQVMSCSRCGSKWQDVYRLVDFITIERRRDSKSGELATSGA